MQTVRSTKFELIDTSQSWPDLEICIHAFSLFDQTGLLIKYTDGARSMINDLTSGERLQKVISMQNQYLIFRQDVPISFHFHKTRHKVMIITLQRININHIKFATA